LASVISISLGLAKINVMYAKIMNNKWIAMLRIDANKIDRRTQRRSINLIAAKESATNPGRIINVAHMAMPSKTVIAAPIEIAVSTHIAMTIGQNCWSNVSGFESSSFRIRRLVIGRPLLMIYPTGLQINILFLYNEIFENLSTQFNNQIVPDKAGY